MEISYILKRAATRYKNKVCIISGETKQTFYEVNQRANSLANGLLSLNSKIGDRVCILLPNMHEYIEIYCALPKIGLTRVPLNYRETWEEHTFKITNCQASTLILDEGSLEYARSCAPKLGMVKNIICIKNASSVDLPKGIMNYEKVIQSASPLDPEVEVDGDVIYRLSHTGGTTGRPKPVMITYKAESELLTNLLLSLVAFKEDDVFLHVHPLSHGSGTLAVPCFSRGATQVIILVSKAVQLV